MRLEGHVRVFLESGRLDKVNSASFEPIGVSGRCYFDPHLILIDLVHVTNLKRTQTIFLNKKRLVVFPSFCHFREQRFQLTICNAVLSLVLNVNQNHL